MAKKKLEVFEEEVVLAPAVAEVVAEIDASVALKARLSELEALYDTLTLEGIHSLSDLQEKILRVKNQLGA
jgi:hypothetical protein